MEKVETEPQEIIKVVMIREELLWLALMEDIVKRMRTVRNPAIAAARTNVLRVQCAFMD